MRSVPIPSLSMRVMAKRLRSKRLRSRRSMSMRLMSGRSVSKRSVSMRVMAKRLMSMHLWSARSVSKPRPEPAQSHHRPARIAVATAAGVAAGLAGAAAGLVHQGTLTAATIERAALASAAADGIAIAGMSAAQLPVPPGDGTYLPGGGDHPDTVRSDQQEPAAGNGLTLAMLGDSTAVGYGCRSRNELPGVVLARRAAAVTGRPVRLVTVGVVGCGAADLIRQVDVALAAQPDVAVVVIGANDIRDRVPPGQSAGQLGRGITALRRTGVPVVVGTCPDFGVIGAIPQPLRSVLRAWSHRLADRQEVVASAAGAAVVPVGRLISPAFAGRRDLFAGDGFHPSGAGYRMAVDALEPAVTAALTARAATVS